MNQSTHRGLGLLLTCCIALFVGSTARAGEDDYATWLRPQLADFSVLGRGKATLHSREKTDQRDDNGKYEKISMYEFGFDLVAPVAIRGPKPNEKVCADEKCDTFTNVPICNEVNGCNSVMDEVIIAPSYYGMHLDTDARLQNDDGDKYGIGNAYGATLPDELYDMDLTLAYRHVFKNNWILITYGSIGSASDKPFDSADEMTYGGGAILKIPHGRYNSFLLYVDYDNARSNRLLSEFPVGGAGYLMAVAERSYVIIGFPMAKIHFNKWKRWKVDVNAIMPYSRSIEAKTSFELVSWAEIYAKYDWGNKTFFRAERKNEDDRLIYWDQRLEAGFHLTPHENVNIGLGGGYAFHRFFYEGQRYSDRRRRIEMDASWYGEMSFDIRF